MSDWWRGMGLLLVLLAACVLGWVMLMALILELAR